MTNFKQDAFELELLWCFVLGVSRTTLRAWPERILNATEEEQFALNALVKRRQQGEPMAYIVGVKEFWSLPLYVNPHVLIPRPETELLVEKILEIFPSKSNADLRVLDLGTGSGAIALALAHERSLWQVSATDQSAQALEVAKTNAKQLGIINVDFYLGDWYEALVGLDANQKQFDTIISNPPYIHNNDPHLTEGDCRFEPIRALHSGADGLKDLKHIIAHAAQYLRTNGWLLVEHGYDQGPQVLALFKEQGFKHCIGLKDLANHNRVVIGQCIKTVK